MTRRERFVSLGLSRPEWRAWAMYDWANSAFATSIMAALLPIFYAKVAARDLAPPTATAYWGYTASASLLLVALLAPALGAAADYLGAKKRFLAAFTIAGAAFTAALCLVREGQWWMASLLYAGAQVGFSGGLVFYDALLPHIAAERDMDRVSAAGYALGYLGGGILLLVNLLWIRHPEWIGLPDAASATRFSFVTVGVWWLIFALPLFIRVAEPPRGRNATETTRSHAVQAAFSRLGDTLHHARQHPTLLRFLLAYWLYSDGIGTVIKMATIYGAEIGISEGDLVGALLLVQAIGLPCTFAFGALGARIGAKAGIQICLGIYALVCVLGYYMHSAWQFWILASLVGLVQGGSQALSRSLFSRMIPRDRSSEYFGFYSVSEKFAGILGPLVFALVGQWAGSSRMGILALVGFFLGGMFLLRGFDSGAPDSPNRDGRAAHDPGGPVDGRGLPK